MTTTEVSTVFGGGVNVADMKQLAAKAQESAQNNPRGGGAPDGSDYMNYSGKRGLLTIGQDKRQVNDDERWVVDVTSFEEGWVCWKGGRPQANRLANIYNGVPVQQPDMQEFGPFDSGRGEGWFQAKAMVLRSVDDDKHQQGYFKINSVSGVSSMADLIEAFAQRAAGGLDAWPLVTISSEGFESQGFQNYKPVFNVEAWLSNAQMEALGSGAEIDEVLEGTEAIEDQSEAKPQGRARSRK